MLFSLEMIQAKHGDCLLLHFGTAASPKLMIIDAGPSGVYQSFLKPRLKEIIANRGLNGKLPVSMIMVSHLDDDHAQGLCELTDEMIADGNGTFLDVTHLWVNTFDDILGNNQIPSIAAIPASGNAASIADLGIPGLNELKEEEQAVIASTAQGRLLRDNARTLTLAVNKPFKKLENSAAILVRGDSANSVVPLSGIKITVVSPDEERLIKLQKQWDKDLKKAKEKGDPSIIAAAFENKDTSVFNLSSIACVVEASGKRILLTGDGRSDYILTGLKKNKLLGAGDKLHVDILKMPHHGSIRNMSGSFLEKITADHYVISADGNYDNPDQELLDLLLAKVKKGVVHFTNSTGKKDLETKMANFKKKVDSKGKFKIDFLPAGRNSKIIDLDTKVNF